MAKRTYPRIEWILLPSFKPKQIHVVEPAHEYSTMFADWDRDDTGKCYHIEKLYPTAKAAIASGREQVEKMAADIAKRQETIKKRIAALDKAEAASNENSQRGSERE